jgi:hypothetical protein
MMSTEGIEAMSGEETSSRRSSIGRCRLRFAPPRLPDGSPGGSAAPRRAYFVRQVLQACPSALHTFSSHARSVLAAAHAFNASNSAVHPAVMD